MGFREKFLPQIYSRRKSNENQQRAFGIAIRFRPRDDSGINEKPILPGRVHFGLCDGVSHCNYGVTQAAGSASATARGYNDPIEEQPVHPASQWVHSCGGGDRPGTL
jgi:hypothetical protein